MRSFILSLALGSAAAFVPASKTAPRPSALQAFEGELGAQAPLGFWDPLGVLENADEDRFDRLREVELKHGRVSMLAVAGHLTTTAGFRLPGALGDKNFADIPNGMKGLAAVPPYGLVQLFFFIGFLELFVMKDVTGEAEFVGDFRNGFIDFGWDKFTPEEKLSKRAIELNNGRAAQMGIFGLMIHEGINNNPYIINEIFSAHVAFNA